MTILKKLLKRWETFLVLFLILEFVVFGAANPKFLRPASIMTAVVNYISVCIICFCLYISFTPTGMDYIDGVQPRYLLPFVFPVLMLLGSGLAAKLLSIDREWKQRLYNGLAFLGSLVILFNAIYVVCISRFT